MYGRSLELNIAEQLRNPVSFVCGCQGYNNAMAFQPKQQIKGKCDFVLRHMIAPYFTSDQARQARRCLKLSPSFSIFQFRSPHISAIFHSNYSAEDGTVQDRSSLL